MAISSADQRALRQFTADHKAGCLRSLESYLPQVSDPSYLATLEELVRLDQAQAFERDARSAPLVENYLDRYPALNDPAIGLRLVQNEYLLRCQHGTPPDASEYRARFSSWISSAQS